MHKPVENDGTEPYPDYPPEDLSPNYVGIVISRGGQWVAIANEGDGKWAPFTKQQPNVYGAERE